MTRADQYRAYGETQYYYFPLSGNISNEDYGEDYEADNSFLAAHAYEIREAIENEQDMLPDNMADYLCSESETGDKLESVAWTVQKLNGKLYGRIDVQLSDSLTESETEELKDELIGQNSDGLGEIFEQHPIRTDEGDLYVSFWQSGSEYFLYDSDEMREYLQNEEMQSYPQM